MKEPDCVSGSCSADAIIDSFAHNGHRESHSKSFGTRPSEYSTYSIPTNSFALSRAAFVISSPLRSRATS
jgi:hypothetical protein